MPKSPSDKTDTIVLRLFDMLKRLHQGERLYSQNHELQEAYGLSERQLARDLQTLERVFSHAIVLSKERHEQSYTKRAVMTYYIARKEDISDVLRFMLSHNDLSYVVKLLNDSDPSIALELDGALRRRVEAALREDDEVFLFKSMPFEQMQHPHAKRHITSLKNAVKLREYRTIYEKGGEVHKDAKCLKIIYMHENWYLAIENNLEQFMFVRISFIDKVDYSAKNSYQKVTLNKYKEFFDTFQNAFSLYGVAKKEAIIQASPKVARYFEEGMKPFFTSQRYIKTTPQGCVHFSVEYTQAIEVLPFVKRWLPDLTVVSPSSLRQEMLEDIQHALKEHEAL